MAKDHFEFARIASPEEVAEYLSSLAVGLKRGEVSLESGERALRLTPGGDVKLEIKVQQKDAQGEDRARDRLEALRRRHGPPTCASPSARVPAADAARTAIARLADEVHDERFCSRTWARTSP